MAVLQLVAAVLPFFPNNKGAFFTFDRIFHHQRSSKIHLQVSVHLLNFWVNQLRGNMCLYEGLIPQFFIVGNTNSALEFGISFSEKLNSVLSPFFMLFVCC